MLNRKAQSALLVCALALAASGCRKRSVQAAPPVLVPPTEQPQPASTEPEPRPQPAPETGPAPAPAPTTPAPRPAPKRSPATAAAPHETSEPPVLRPAAPQISPQLSPEELAQDQRSTNEDIAVTEKNLQQANGRELTASQHDLVEKIRSFLTQTHEAIQNSDWVRARNLAHKAYLLSVELVKSL